MARTIVKEVKGQGALKNKVIGRLYDDGTILCIDVRFSYPHIGEPYAGTNDKGEPGTPKYGVVGMLPKDTHAPLKDLIVEEMTKILREQKIEFKNFPAEKKFMRNGDQSGKEAYVGHWIVSTREERQPAIRNGKLERLRDKKEIADLFYGGAWGAILIRPWWQSNKYGKRVNAGLSAIQFIRHDDAFGEGRISDDEIDDTFEAYEDEEGGGFDDDDGLGGTDDDDHGL